MAIPVPLCERDLPGRGSARRERVCRWGGAGRAVILSGRVWLLVTVLAAGPAVLAQDAAPAATQPASAAPAQPTAEATVLLNEAIDLYNQVAASEVDKAVPAYQQLEAAAAKVPAAAGLDTPVQFVRALASAEMARKYESLYQAAYAEATQAPAERQPAQVKRLKDQAAEYYQRAHRQMEAVLAGRLVDDYTIARLVDAVVQVKLAGYAGGAPAGQEPARMSMLQQAQRAVEAYLSPPAGSGLQPPGGLNRVRAEYTLGVILYRQGIRPEQAGVSLATSRRVTDPARLDSAARQFGILDEQEKVQAMLPADMAGREGVARQWASYASFYLGLTRTWQANLMAERGRNDLALAYYNQARQSLATAYEYDTGKAFPRLRQAAPASGPATQPSSPSSASGLIYRLVDQQWSVIDESVVNLGKRGAPLPVEDLQLDWMTGLAYDTNVILLGDNTVPPRRISDKDDFRVETGLALQYTVDLAKYSSRLDRWSVAALARASAGWNADIHSYNQQDYGASVAARYTVWQPADVHANLGPLYASLQYDYDDFLLGNQDFVGVHRLFPHLTLYSWDQRGTTDLGFTFEDREYHERLRSHWYDRSGDYYSVGLTHSQKVLDMAPFYERHGLQPSDLQNDPDPRSYYDWRWLQPYAGFRYGWDITEGREYDDRWSLLTVGVAAPLPKGWTFLFDAQWEWQNYASHSKVDFHRRGRLDRIQRYGFGVQRRFVLNPGDQDAWRTLRLGRVVMVVRGDIRWIVDDSNVESWPHHAVFSYDRAIYGVNLTLQLD